MAVPVWPASLPQAMTRDDYSGSFGDGRERAPPEFGPAAIFLRTSAVAEPVRGRIIVDLTGLVILKNFWKVDLGRGRKPFLMPDQDRDGAPVTDSNGVIILGTDGNPVRISAKWLVQFVDPPSHAQFGLEYAVTLSLEILPM
jgi:hypothetical protein